MMSFQKFAVLVVLMLFISQSAMAAPRLDSPDKKPSSLLITLVKSLLEGLLKKTPKRDIPGGFSIPHQEDVKT